MLFVCGMVTAALESENIKPIVVGGFAVEFYTLGSYTTHDIDLVILEHQKADQIFEQLGFVKEGRHWYHSEADVAIESPASILKDADLSKVTEIDVEGYKIYLIGVEDLILDRLRAGVYWKSTEDVESAKDLLINCREQIDWEYLKNQAHKESEVEQLLLGLGFQIV